MEKKIARINWSRGQYSDAFRSAIVDPSPIKQGQKVKVTWGKTKKEYTAVITCYPVVQENSKPAPENAKLGPRMARAKRKLMPDYEYEGDEVAKKVAKKVQKAPTDKPQDKKKKEKPKGKILDVESPSRGTHCVIDSSDESSGSADEKCPLISVAVRPLQRRDYPPSPVSPPPDNLDDYSDDEADPASMAEVISEAMTAVDKTNRMCQRDESSDIALELRLTRTILERLECSFAHQEAKLDRLLSLMATTQTNQQPTFQCHPQTDHRQTLQQFSTPNPTTDPSQFLELPPYTPPVVLNGTPLSDVERLSDVIGAPDSVPVGGSTNVRLARADFDHVQSSSKPTSMALRLLDKLFSKETLLKSTVYGTKTFAALDSSKISAIKAEVTRAFSYQCRTSEETARMWDQCRISIGKRCQHLRKNEKQNLRD